MRGRPCFATGSASLTAKRVPVATRPSCRLYFESRQQLLLGLFIVIRCPIEIGQFSHSLLALPTSGTGIQIGDAHGLASNAAQPSISESTHCRANRSAENHNVSFSRACPPATTAMKKAPTRGAVEREVRKGRALRRPRYVVKPHTQRTFG